MYLKETFLNIRPLKKMASIKLDMQYAKSYDCHQVVFLTKIGNTKLGYITITSPIMI